MAESNQLNYGWLVNMSNANHDGTTQQIDDAVQAFQSDNAVFNQKKAALHAARQKEDEVWLTSQRDSNVKLLEAADKKQDAYVSAARYIMTAHAGLPDDEPTKAEAKECLQVYTDYDFRTDNNYSAESDKIIQMHQNLLKHQAFLTQIGAWAFYLKAVEQARQVRLYLSERAKTLGAFVKGEMKAARTATDQAVADLYKVINAMTELMPSAQLTELVVQLKGIEIYAKRYYIGGSGGGTTPEPGTSTDPENPGTGGGGTTPDPGTTTDPDPENPGTGGGGTTPDPSQGGGGSTDPEPDPDGGSNSDE